VPAPQASVMKLAAKNKFRSFAIKLPQKWAQPMAVAGKQYVDAFTLSEHAWPDTGNKLFVPATTNKYHVETAKKMGKDYEKFIDDICSAICTGWQQWMAASTITKVIISANVGTITPGSIVGPPLFPLALAPAPKHKPYLAKFSTAIATAVGNAWTTWSVGYMGTLQYPPTFATCPSPVHPPTPNIPMPVKTAGSSPGEAMLQASALKSSMIGLLGDPKAPHHKELFESIATAFKSSFDQWALSTQVSNVLGTGPVPTFCPPWTPVGPVLGGMGNGVPGSVFL